MPTKSDIVLSLLQTGDVKALTSSSEVLTSFAERDLTTILVRILPKNLSVDDPREVWLSAVTERLHTLLDQYSLTVEAKAIELHQQIEARAKSYSRKESEGMPLSDLAFMGGASALEVQFAEFRTSVWQELATIKEWMFWLSQVVLSPDPEDAPEESTARDHNTEV